MLLFLNDVKDKIVYNFEIFMKYFPLLYLILYYLLCERWMNVCDIIFR